MAYSDFTFLKLRQNFGIAQDSKSLFDKKLPKAKVSAHLIADIKEGKLMSVTSEKAKSEFLIAPVIRELFRQYKHLTIFSGVSLNIEGEKDLNGMPDFMLSAKPRRASLEAPIFCLVESKNQSVEDGFAQCAAEMYAARLFNKQSGEPYEIIYGAVTNAFDWVFLKLEGDTFFIDSERYYLDNLPKLLGVMKFIVEQYAPK
jgi:hypothetical protein